jgi:hypothetical protein
LGEYRLCVSPQKIMTNSLQVRHVTCGWIIFHGEQATSVLIVKLRQAINFTFVDPCIIVQFIKKNPTRCNNVSKFYYSVFIWSSTCFGWHIAHYQEPKTTLVTSDFSYVEGFWKCSWWTLSGTVYCAWQRPPTTRPTTFHV